MCRSLNESKICIESRISWRLYLFIHIFLFIRGSLFWSVWRVRVAASFGKCNDAWSLNSSIVEHTLEAGTGQQIHSWHHIGVLRLCGTQPIRLRFYAIVEMPKMATANKNPIKIPNGTGLPCVIPTVGYDSHRRWRWKRTTADNPPTRDITRHTNKREKKNQQHGQFVENLHQTRVRSFGVGDDHLFVGRNAIFLLVKMK